MEILIQLVHYLASKWYIGLFISGTAEGLSLPFPSQPLVLYIGYIINVKQFNMLIAATFFAIPYTFASMVPYFIGYKCGPLLFNSYPKYQKYFDRSEAVFTKYGDISVFFTRPFTIGNYISYLAGMYNMNFAKYFCLTFLGIFIWTVVILFLGGQLGIKLTTVINLIAENLEVGIIILLGIIILSGLGYIFLRYSQKSQS